MLPSAVVEHLNVIDHIISGFLTGGIMTMRRALALETAEEPLRDRMVQAIPLPAHTTFGYYELPGDVGMPDTHIDYLDLHDASVLLRASDVPAPSATPPAPTLHQHGYSSPSPPLSGHTSRG